MKQYSCSIYCATLVLLLTACSLSPTSVHKVGSFDTGTAYHVSVQGNYAYVANNDGVAVIDISAPNRPREIALIELKEAAFAVLVRDDLVFIAAPADGLVIADVQEPESPQILGSYAVDGINTVCVFGNTAFASTADGDLHILDIGDPAHPTLLSTYQPGGGRSLMVTCLQDTVYFSTANLGLQVIDVSDPLAPLGLKTVPATQGAIDFQVVGELLYLACHANGVRILDISDPLSPKRIATFNDGGEAWGVGGDSQHLWIGDLQQGIEIYAVTNPRAPANITTDHRYAPHDLFFDGHYTYLADQDRGFIILEYTAGN